MKVVPLFMLLTAASQADKGSVEIIRPESYSIRRFQEIIQNANLTEEHTSQEQLISMRARLIIARQKLQDLKTRSAQQQLSANQNEAPQIKEVHIRAAQAQVDHYAKLVDRYEDRILKEKRQQRSEPRRKKR